MKREKEADNLKMEMREKVGIVEFANMSVLNLSKNKRETLRLHFFFPHTHKLSLLDMTAKGKRCRLCYTIHSQLHNPFTCAFLPL